MSEHQITTANVELTYDHQVNLLDELQILLTEQLQLARQGDAANERFGVLTNKAGSLINEIERTGILDLDDFQSRREELRQRYENLCLIVAAQKTNVCRELSQIRKGRKTINVYRTNTPSNTDRIL